MRHLWVIVHRWAGLTIAAFLFFSGVTGAIISWDHELDDLINPELTHSSTPGTPMPALQLVELVEKRHPDVAVSYFTTAAEPGDSYSVFVSPKIDPATGKLYEPGFNQVFMDPVTGQELGKREWGAVWPVTKETFVSFLYKLHYTMHIPEFMGIENFGTLVLGIVALIWTLDCFVGFYLTLPKKKKVQRDRDDISGDAATLKARGYMSRWAPAWKVRWDGGSTKLNFDIHRALSLWTWVLLFLVAFTAFSLNLYREVFFPMMSMVSKVTPTPFDVRTPTADKNLLIKPAVTRERALEIGHTEGQRNGWDPLGALFYADRYGIYQANFFPQGEDHGAGGVGPLRLYIDAQTGEVLGKTIPWSGTVADVFVQAQFPIHSGRILGLPGRVLISIMGVVVAALSVTGVIIWWRKRRARVAAQAAVAGIAARSPSASSDRMEPGRAVRGQTAKSSP